MVNVLRLLRIPTGKAVRDFAVFFDDEVVLRIVPVISDEVGSLGIRAGGTTEYMYLRANHACIDFLFTVQMLRGTIIRGQAP